MQDCQAKCQVRKVKTNIRSRDEIKAPTRTYGPPSPSAGKGSQQSESEEDRATATLRLSLDATGATALTAGQACQQRPGSAGRGRYVNPASSTASAQGRKAQTYDPLRDKVRSQPRRKDHQAYRNSKGSQQLKARKTGPTRTYGPPSRSTGKGSQQSKSEEDRATATLCLSLDATGATVLTAGQAC